MAQSNLQSNHQAAHRTVGQYSHCLIHPPTINCRSKTTIQSPHHMQQLNLVSAHRSPIGPSPYPTISNRSETTIQCPHPMQQLNLQSAGKVTNRAVTLSVPRPSNCRPILPPTNPTMNMQPTNSSHLQDQSLHGTINSLIVATSRSLCRQSVQSLSHPSTNDQS